MEKEEEILKIKNIEDSEDKIQESSNAENEEQKIERKITYSFNEEKDLKEAKEQFEDYYYDVIHDALKMNDVPFIQSDEEIFEMFVQFYKGLVATQNGEQTDFDLETLKQKYPKCSVAFDACYNVKNIKDIIFLFQRIYIDICMIAKEKALKEKNHLELDYDWKLLSCCMSSTIEDVFDMFRNQRYWSKNNNMQFYCYFNGIRIDSLMTKKQAYDAVYGASKDNIPKRDTYYLISKAQGDLYTKLFLHNTKNYVAKNTLKRWYGGRIKHGVSYGDECLSEVLLAIGRSNIPCDEAFGIVNAQEHSGHSHSWTLESLFYYAPNGKELEAAFNDIVKKYARDERMSFKEAYDLLISINFDKEIAKYYYNNNSINKTPQISNKSNPKKIGDNSTGSKGLRK